MKYFFVSLLGLLFCNFSFAHQILPELSTALCETKMIKASDVAHFRNLKETNPSIRMVGQIKGEHGGYLIVLERKALFDSWFSTFSFVRYANQGDPRSLVSVLGPSLALFFGVRELPNGRITIPDPQELMGAIKKLSVTLVSLGYKPIPIQYYPHSIENIDHLMFIKKIIETFAFPYADHGLVQIHDAAYHLATLVLPAEVLLPLLARYNWALQFYYYAQSHYPEETQFLSAYLAHLERRLDGGLGNLQPFFNHQAILRQTTSLSHEEVVQNFERVSASLTFNHSSQKDMVLQIIASVHDDDVSDETMWKVIFNRFLRSQDPAVYNAKYPFSTAEVYDRLKARQIEMELALQKLISSAKQVKP